jgi:hypothetical protein
MKNLQNEECKLVIYRSSTSSKKLYCDKKMYGICKICKICHCLDHMNTFCQLCETGILCKICSKSNCDIRIYKYCNLCKFLSNINKSNSQYNIFISNPINIPI